MWIALLAAASLLALDRLLKHLARQGKLTFSAANGHVVTTHHENSGMMFGLCKKQQTLTRYLPCVSLLAVLSYFLPHFSQRSTLSKAGIVLFTLGGISNIYDRIRRGSVTDYIRFPKFPVKKLVRLVWNVADFMILLGALFTWVGTWKDK